MEMLSIDETLSIVFIVALGSVFFGLLAVGHYLVARDTARRKSQWGINTEPMTCQKCHTPAPSLRIPKNMNQTLWGGWTCAECGYELDKWGEPVAKQPFPAKWSAKIDEQPNQPNTDITRMDESHA